MKGQGGCVPAIPSGLGSGVGEPSSFPNTENRLLVSQRRGASQQSSVNTNSPCEEFTYVLKAPKPMGTVIQQPFAVLCGACQPLQIPVLWSITLLPSCLLLDEEISVS